MNVVMKNVSQPNLMNLFRIDYWVIHYCIAGEGIFQIEDKQNHIKAGDIFMIPPYTKNKYYPLPEILGVIIGSVYEESKLTNF